MCWDWVPICRAQQDFLLQVALFSRKAQIAFLAIFFSSNDFQKKKKNLNLLTFKVCLPVALSIFLVMGYALPLSHRCALGDFCMWYKGSINTCTHAKTTGWHPCLLCCSPPYVWGQSFPLNPTVTISARLLTSSGSAGLCALIPTPVLGSGDSVPRPGLSPGCCASKPRSPCCTANTLPTEPSP